MLVVGTTVTLLLLTIACFHAFWAVGGTFGYRIAYPRVKGRSMFKLGPLELALIALGHFVAALIVVGNIGHFTFSLLTPYYHTGTILVGVVVGLRAIGDFRHFGFFKSDHRPIGAKYDTFLISPLCAFICWGCFYIL